MRLLCRYRCWQLGLPTLRGDVRDSFMHVVSRDALGRVRRRLRGIRNVDRGQPVRDGDYTLSLGAVRDYDRPTSTRTPV
jgi:hypothetical protein